jgi:hypothetical protein
MKRLVSLVVLSISILALSAPGDVRAAAKNNTASEPVGYDVSYPQCSRKLPTTAAFAIVGVNGGTTANTNPCLSTQLAWAKKVTTKNPTKQSSLQLYVNTGNPGNFIADIMTWPTNNVDKSGTLTSNPYGDCAGSNDLPCSWQYGWNRAEEALVDRFVPAAQKAGVSTKANDYKWWLDVELANTWQVGSSEAFARNTAMLEGMAAYFTDLSRGGTIGLYSTAVQWTGVTDNTKSTSFAGLPNWRPSGSVLTNAINNCKVAPLTSGGYISLTQYVQGGIDKNHSCL